MAGFGGGVQGVGGYVARAVAEVQQAQGTAGPGVPGFVDGAGGVGGDGGFVGSFDDLRLRAGSCGAGGLWERACPRRSCVGPRSDARKQEVAGGHDGVSFAAEGEEFFA